MLDVEDVPDEPVEELLPEGDDIGNGVGLGTNHLDCERVGVKVPDGKEEGFSDASLSILLFSSRG